MSEYPRPRETYSNSHFSILGPAADEITDNLMSPYRIPWMAALSVASISTQGLVDVKSPNGHIEPVSLFNCTIALSGERKTAIDNLVKRGLTRFEEVERKKYEAAMASYEIEVETHDVIRQALAAAIRRAISDGGDVEAAQVALAAHRLSRPAKPALVRVCYEDVTAEALAQNIGSGFPIAALSSSEGAGMLNGRALAGLEMLNQAWSSGALYIDRKSKGSVSLPWYRLVISIMIQPEPLERYLDGKGQKAKGLGFWARALVCLPGSTQGNRLSYHEALSWERTDRFADRVEALLRQALELISCEGYAPEILEFSSEAAAYWFDIHNRIEGEIRPGGRYERAGDHASKLCSNISRVAAVLHYFEGFEGAISIDTLKMAEIICEDASMDYLKVFVPPPREIKDAQLLDTWFDGYRKQGAESLPRNFSRKHCPNSLRSEGRFYIALEILRRQGVISEILDAKCVSHIILNPNAKLQAPVEPVRASPWVRKDLIEYPR